MKLNLTLILTIITIIFSTTNISSEETVNQDFLNRWKRIKVETQQRSFETQQTRMVAGVRGAEAEDTILDQLYYKGGVRYPSRLDLSTAITQLQESIKLNPESQNVPEQLFFIAQCQTQLGDINIAKETYNNIIKKYNTTNFAKLSQQELNKIK